jgi:hypothetical protein
LARSCLAYGTSFCPSSVGRQALLEWAGCIKMSGLVTPTAKLPPSPLSHVPPVIFRCSPESDCRRPDLLHGAKGGFDQVPRCVATAAPTLPSTTGMSTAVTPPPAVSTTPPASKPAVGGVPARELNPADIPFATWAPGKRGVVKSPFDPDGRLIDVRDFNPGQLSQCPYSGKIFRVPPMK